MMSESSLLIPELFPFSQRLQGHTGQRDDYIDTFPTRKVWRKVRSKDQCDQQLFDFAGKEQ